MKRFVRFSCFSSVVALSLAPLLASAASASLGDAELLIAGTRLTVSPESQTVPYDTPTVVETQLEGYDAGQGVLPPGLRVLGDLTGPEIDGVLRLETVPNEPFRIPRLSLKGQYQLDNIRLVQGDELLAYAEPRSAGVFVTQVLVTRVTSRALTLDEIRSYGIVIDDDNFKAFEFTFGFAVAGETIDYNVPVVYNYAEERVETLGSGGGGTGVRFHPPQLAPFLLEARPPGFNPEVGGCENPEGCSISSVPPLPGAILFPTDTSLLNQFFSVVLMAQNGAPEGDPLVIRDLTAKISLPSGLRIAETAPPTVLGVPVPIRVPGPDGELGTADDITFLVAQATGEAEFLVEGLKEGTHIVEFGLEGILEGLPTGIQRVTGTARGAVVVRDPTLNITITHPDVVRTSEEYDLLLTVTNTSNAPANLLSVRLPPSGLAGVEVIGDNEQTVDTLLPGDTELMRFRLRSLLTGRVVSAAVRSDSHIDPTFDLTVGVGENGIPLSPTSIILPKETDSLPPTLVEEALKLIGLGFSLATAPPAAIGADLPKVGREMVDERVFQLAQAGRTVDLGEDLFDATAVLASEWTGVRDADWEWDVLRRSTEKGALVGVALGEIFAAEASVTDPIEVFERFAATTAYLPPQSLALAMGDGVRLTVSSRTSGKSGFGTGLATDRVRELPFADLYDLGGAELVLLSVPEENGYRVRVADLDGGEQELHLLVPDPAAQLRTVRWTDVGLGPHGVAVVDIAADFTDFTLMVDGDGDGLVDEQLPGTVGSLQPRPFSVVSAAQNASQDPTGHVVDVLFSAEVDGELLRASRDPSRFELPTKVSNGGNVLAGAGIFAERSNSRIVRVAFNNPLSPYVAHEMTVRDVTDRLGRTIAEESVDVEIRIETPGTLVTGTVVGPDGQPVPYAEVELLESDYSTFKSQCIRHRTAAVRTGTDGRFLFDYVRQTECGGLYVLRATDPASNREGEASGRVRFIGETIELDIVMLGRGLVRGRVLYDDGTVPAHLRVVAHSPIFQEGRLALTDEAGYYEVGDLPVGTVELSASDGQGNFALSTIEVPRAGAVVERDLTIVRRSRPTGELRGRVFAADGAAPVFNAYVALYVEGQFLEVRRSDEEGRFDFGTVPAGVAEIEAFDGESGRSGARIFFEVLADRVNDVDVLLVDERGTVAGRVFLRRADGSVEPLAGVVVFVQGMPQHATTDASGSYRLEGVFAGTSTIEAVDIDGGREASASITITADGEVVTRDLYIDELPGDSGGIAGEVLDFEGNPVAAATVHLALGPEHWFMETTTDAAGRFEITGLFPGVYEVHAFRGADGGVATARVEFSGDTPFVTIRFKRGEIRGQVLARNEGGDLVGVPSVITYRTTVVRLGLLGLSLAEETIETDADGSFVIPDVLAGGYVITAHNAFHGSKTVQGELVEHGEVVNHEFVFERNGSIGGVVLDHDGVTPVEGAEVTLHHPGFVAELTADEEGRFLFELVPPTPAAYPITVHAEQGTVFRDARIYTNLSSHGQHLEVEIVLPKQGSIAGWVEDSFGERVPDAVVRLKESRYPARELNATSDANGTFSFTNVFEGRATLSARDLQGLGGKVVTEIVEEGETVEGLVIRLEEIGEIAGVVRSPVDGAPVPSAEVKLHRGGSFFDSTNSDDLGEFRFTVLPLGTYSVRVFDPASGRQGREDGLAISVNGEVVDSEVVLEARGEVDGHLYEPGSVTPVPAATVRLQSRGLVSFTTYSSTDAEGFFEFLGIPQGEFELFAREPDGRRRAEGEGEIVDEGELVSVDLYLEESGGVVGSVLSPVAGSDELFADVTVQLYQNGLIGATLDNPFAFDGVLAGRGFTVKAVENGGLHRGEASGKLSFEGEVVELDVRMVPIGAVEVTVVDAGGSTVEGAKVTVSNAGFYGGRFVGQTDSQGVVSFQDVGAGSLYVAAEDQVTGLGGVTTGDLVNEGELVELTVMLEESGFVRGTVLLADGETPAAGAVAAIVRGGTSYTTTADAAGLFEFPVLPLGGFSLHLQQHLGPGELSLTGTVDTDGVELGTLVLDDADPEVVAVEPPAGMIDVDVDSAVTVTFSEPLDADRFTGGWVRLRKTGGGTVSVASTWSENDTRLTLTPKSPLTSFTSYQISISTDVVDPAGRHLEAAVQSSFTTADVVPPEIVEVMPAPGAVQVPVDVQLRLTFSEPVVESSLSGTAIQLTDLTAGIGVTTTFTLQPGGTTVLVTPVSTLAQQHLHELVVQGVTDLAGNPLEAPFATDFRSFDDIGPDLELVAPEGPWMEGESHELAATVTGVDDVATVEFFADGVSLSVDSEPSYGTEYRVTATAAEAGRVEISVVGTDELGNLGPTIALTRLVEVNPPPEIDLVVTPTAEIYPTQGLTVGVTVFDDLELDTVELVVSGAIEASVVENASGSLHTYSERFTVPIPAPSDTISVVVRATDALGKSTETEPAVLSVLEDVEPPTIGATTPLPDAEYQSFYYLEVTAEATDDVGVADVTFSMAGSEFVDSTAPYVWETFAPEVETSTDVEISATARDAAGNTSTERWSIRVVPLGVPSAEILCPASGDAYLPDTPLTVSFVLEDDYWIVGYKVLVNSVLLEEVAANGETRLEAQSVWTPPADARPGDVHTIRVEVTDDQGYTRFDEIEMVMPAGTVLTSPRELDVSLDGQRLVLGPGEFSVTEPLAPLALTTVPGTLVRGETGEALTFAVTGRLHLSCDSALDVVGLGYRGADGTDPNGEAPEWVAPSEPVAGGSHGGRGAAHAYDDDASPGEVYGSVYAPGLGGGGGASFVAGGAGGGSIDLTAAEVVLNGTITAKGEELDMNGTAGAGGSILLSAGSLRGIGSIDASGGDPVSCCGDPPQPGGGGGRVALYVDDLSGFDVADQVLARDGWDQEFGDRGDTAAPGTILVADGESTYGDLLIDRGAPDDVGLDPASATARPREQGFDDLPVTELPRLGAGAVAGLEANGANAWLSGGSRFYPRWIGAWMILSDDSGAELGVFQVLEIDERGRALLAGAAGIDDAGRFHGEYRFDSVALRNGAGLLASDPLRTETFEGGSEALVVPELTVGGDLLLDHGVTMTSPAGRLRLEVDGTLTVRDRAFVDVSGRGYRGGESDSPNGSAPSAVLGSRPDAGGSHGGFGSTGEIGSDAGEVYDSVYLPSLGGGGAALAGDAPGSRGGGVIEIVAAEVVLDGEVRARGEEFRVWDSAGGAGGTVSVVANRLSGNGWIDVGGGSTWTGDTQPAVGAGGGGRVALVVDDLDGFDVKYQVGVEGGSVLDLSTAAASGTVYVADLSSRHGDLHVGLNARSWLPQSKTILPNIGFGTIGTVSVDSDEPADLWIEPADPDHLFSLGVVGMSVRVGGVDYPVVAQSPDRRRVLLIGAAGAVGTGDVFEGIYSFDTVYVQGGSTLEFLDTPVVDEFIVDPDSTVIVP